jgi:hypothetical protein
MPVLRFFVECQVIECQVAERPIVEEDKNVEIEIVEHP